MKKISVALFSLIVWILLPQGALADGWTKFNGWGKPLEDKNASHIRHLVATKYAIYALGLDNELLRFPFDGSRATQERLPGRVIGISEGSNGDLWVLTVEELSNNAYVLTRDQDDSDPKAPISAFSQQYPMWKVSPPLPLLKLLDEKIHKEGVITVAAGTKYTFVLTDHRLAALDQSAGSWKTVTLDHPFDFVETENPTSLVQDDRWLWYGSDAGEFGGQLIMVDFRTGDTAEPSSEDEVTAIVSDPGQEHCVLFTEGLAHLGMTEGGLYRTCGDKPATLFSGREPIWDLVSSKSGLYALSQGALVPIKDGKLDTDDKMVFPKKVDKSVAGLPARLISDTLVLYSGARWEVSTSGLTPYAISLPPEAKLKLQAYPLEHEYLSDCADAYPSSDDDTGIHASQYMTPVKLDNGEPALEIFLKGWDPSDEASVYGVDLGCHIVPIIPVGKLQRISDDKTATILIPYATHGLHEGIWSIVVSVNVSRKHAVFDFSLDIPKSDDGQK